MSIAHDKKMMGRLQKAAAVAALLVAGAMTAGCSHTAPAPTVVAPPMATAPAPTGAPTPPGATTVSPMSAGDQQEMQKKEDENKGITAPP